MSGELISENHPDFNAYNQPSHLSRPRFPTAADLDPYTIVDIQNDRRRVEGRIGNYKKNAWDGLLFTTREKGTWFVIPPPPPGRLTVQRNVPYLNGAGEALQNRQVYTGAKMSEAEHTDSLLFLASVPNSAFQAMYYGNTYAPGEPNRIRPLVEVDFNDLVIKRSTQKNQLEEACGQADMIDVGPDGQVIMTEIGSSGLHRKSLQVTRHSLGTEFVVRETNHGKVPPITRFVAIYERPNPLKKFTVIRIYPAVPERIHEYHRAVVHPVRQTKPTEVFNARNQKKTVAYN